MTLEQLSQKVNELAEKVEPALAFGIISFVLLVVFVPVVFVAFYDRITRIENKFELVEEQEEKRSERKKIVDEIIDYFERTK